MEIVKIDGKIYTKALEILRGSYKGCYFRDDQYGCVCPVGNGCILEDHYIFKICIENK